MALRNIRKYDKDYEILRKKCKDVKVIDNKIKELLRDMVETMYHEVGVGLAAPQVGILKRIAVIDVGEGLITLINPVIIKESGEQQGLEGCLSVPGITGEVVRPEKVRVRAQNEKGKFFELEGKGLLARAFCHELDHLDGILFTDKMIPNT
ncbi:MAG: peptide deformylase [Lachnospiraceae bacterium]|nr:peptide deformylase [Lachnospiraceae bacterium]